MKRLKAVTAGVHRHSIYTESCRIAARVPKKVRAPSITDLLFSARCEVRLCMKKYFTQPSESLPEHLWLSVPSPQVLSAPSWIAMAWIKMSKSTSRILSIWWNTLPYTIRIYHRHRGCVCRSRWCGKNPYHKRKWCYRDSCIYRLICFPMSVHPT